MSNQGVAKTMIEIERIRDQLHDLVNINHKSLLDQEIYEVSVKLDKLIVNIMRKKYSII